MKKGNLKRLLLAMFAAYWMMRLVTFGIGNVNPKEIKELDDYISTQVIRADGTKEFYPSNKFRILNYHDTAIGTLYLPKELEIENAGISFRLSNCKINIYYEEELLYSYGNDLFENNQLIGSCYVKVAVPKQAWGNALTIVCVSAENDAGSSIGNVKAMEATDLVRYPLIHREMGLMMYIAMFIISCMMCLYFLLNGKYDSLGRQGIYLSLFTTLASTWILTYTGIYTVFSDRMNLYAHFEYIALFLMPVPFTLYLFEQQKGQKYEKLLGYIAIVLGLFFVVTTILNYTTVQYHYTRMVKYFHGLMLIACSLVIGICSSAKNKERRDRYILLSGFSITILMFLIDMGIYNINKYTSYDVGDRRFSYSEVGIAIFLATTLFGYVIRLLDVYFSQKEKLRLQQLAYSDGMTNFINRAGCYEMMKELDQKENAIYEVLYFDVNSLKKTNDVLGHESGDQLILCVVELIRKSFGSYGFCGRLGGDEFIVLIENQSKKKIQKLITQFEEEMKRVNKEQQYPFTISVSCGRERHEKDDIRPVEEVIRVADSKMYAEKKLTKQ